MSDESSLKVHALFSPVSFWCTTSAYAVFLLVVVDYAIERVGRTHGVGEILNATCGLVGALLLGELLIGGMLRRCSSVTLADGKLRVDSPIAHHTWDVAKVRLRTDRVPMFGLSTVTADQTVLSLSDGGRPVYVQNVRMKSGERLYDALSREIDRSEPHDG